MIKKYRMTITAIVDLNTEDFDAGVLDDEDTCADIVADLVFGHMFDYTPEYEIEEIS